MMPSADLRNRNDTPHFRRLYGPRLRCVLLQSQVCPGSVIVVQELSKMPAKASFIEYDDVVQALADGSHDPFHIGTLPGRALRRQDLLNPHGFYPKNENLPKKPIAISQQITGRRIPRECFSE